MCKIINEKHHDRLKKLLNNEDILWGSKVFNSTLKFQPTLIDSGDISEYLNGAKKKTNILKEEIFGPFFPIITYNKIEDVIEYINNDEKPLALYLYSNDKNIQDKIINSISFGGGCINDSLVHLANEHLPFGGVGYSGQGSYHGYASFLAFSHEKSILHSNTKIDLPVKYLPYSKHKLKILKKLFK